MSQHPPCPFCGSLRFEEENGVLVCTSCGRQQEGGLQVEDDDADFGTQGKITRRKVEKTKIKVSKVYHGAQAYRLYLQGWQQILWRQAHSLIHGSVQAPPELWTVTRDLWALRLTKLVQRLESNQRTSHDYGNHDGEVTADSEADMETTELKDTIFLAPRLWDSISTVYIAALLLQFPLPLYRIYRLIRTEELPFIRAVRHVPTEITSKLPSEYQLALDTVTIPTASALQRAVYRTIRTYSADFGMSFPPVNWRLLLLDYIEELGIPIEVCSTVKRLAAIVKYDCAYEISSQQVSGNDHEAVHKSKRRRSPVAMAEVQLISLIVISVKLFFPFPIALEKQNNGTSDFLYYPQSNDWPNFHLDWSAWLRVRLSRTNASAAQSNDHTATLVQPGGEIEVKDRDILNMTPDQLDTYMDWYQRTFTTPEAVLASKKTELEKSILDMFPLPNLPPASNIRPSSPSSSDDLVSRFQHSTIQPFPLSSSHKANPRDTNSSTSLPALSQGPQYPIFPTPDSLFIPSSEDDAEPGADNDNENPVLAFHRCAAELACVDLNGLLRAVRHTERKLETWIAERKRKEVFGTDDEEEGTEEREED